MLTTKWKPHWYIFKKLNIFLSVCLFVCSKESHSVNWLSICPSCFSSCHLFVYPSVQMSFCPSICLEVFLVYLFVCLSVYPSLHMPFCLLIYLYVFLLVHPFNVFLSVHLFICLSVCPSIYMSFCLPCCSYVFLMSTYSYLFLSVHLFGYSTFFLSAHFPVSLPSVCLFICDLSICTSVCSTVSLFWLSLSSSFGLSLCLSVHLSNYLSILLSVYSPFLLSVSLNVCLFDYLSLSIFLTGHSHICFWIRLSVRLGARTTSHPNHFSFQNRANCVIPLSRNTI
jgi:hypothetical protein